MYNLIPYKHEHIVPLLEQSINSNNKDFFLKGSGRLFEEKNVASTMIDSNGKVIMCGAIEEIWHNRGVIWCIFNEECKTNFVPVFRTIRKFIKDSKFKRIEVCIPCDFKQGKRRAELMGFSIECERARKYLPDGSDCSVYSLVKD